ncbi:hypothetical protein VTH06DRAFT_3012 [Thermothelomyces fergusii]
MICTAAGAATFQACRSEPQRDVACEIDETRAQSRAATRQRKHGTDGDPPTHHPLRVAGLVWSGRRSTASDRCVETGALLDVPPIRPRQGAARWPGRPT